MDLPPAPIPVPAETPADTSGDHENDTVHHATQWQKVVLIVCNLVMAVGAISWAYATIRKFNEATFVETAVSWKLPAGVHLKDGPAAFHYDPEHHTLNYRGSLDAELQLRLRDLLEFDTVPDEKQGSVTSASTTNAAIRSYQAAIDKLAYQTAAIQIGQIQLLMLLGLMGGTLGAILRSLVDFVGHACYTGKLDLSRWWPLYATRPLVGAILGFVLVILLKARLLTSTDIQQGTESFWWLGVAVLGGFSTVDVTQRLRLAAKALFGTTHDNPNG
jgi:hypothetical protein